MKLAFLSKALRTIGLTASLTLIVSTTLHQTAQAQFGVSEQGLMPCSEAYLTDPDFMYYGVESVGASAEQLEEIERITAPILAEMESIPDEINMFAVELDSPIGYVANKVNGVAVEIPPEIEQAINRDNAYPYSREKVKTLNEKYGQYATFGQQLTLVFSSDQTKRYSDLLREFNTLTGSVLTDEQKQTYLEPYTSNGSCNVNYSFADMGFGSIVVEVGQRPELDARLREDTTGAIFFR